MSNFVRFLCTHILYLKDIRHPWIFRVALLLKGNSTNTMKQNKLKESKLPILKPGGARVLSDKYE